jgi:hypothetical protein
MKSDDTVINAILAAWENLPMRDCASPGSELDRLRKLEAARAALNAYHDYIRRHT